MKNDSNKTYVLSSCDEEDGEFKLKLYNYSNNYNDIWNKV